MFDMTDVVGELWVDDWQQTPVGFAKFIGSYGSCPAVPGRPSEWGSVVEKAIKKFDYTAEHGIDWWLYPVNGKHHRNIVYGAEIRMSPELYKHLSPQMYTRVRPPPPFRLGVIGVTSKMTSETDNLFAQLLLFQ